MATNSRGMGQYGAYESNTEINNSSAERNRTIYNDREAKEIREEINKLREQLKTADGAKKKQIERQIKAYESLEKDIKEHTSTLKKTADTINKTLGA